MRGLTSVLDRFSEGLRTRKILPSLLEEMKDTHLLPYILPNVFAISHILSPQQFASLVLPSLKPLFAVKEPPQNMMTLLDNLKMLQEKTEKSVFRERTLSSPSFLRTDAEFVHQMCCPWFTTLWNLNTPSYVILWREAHCH